MRKKAKKEAEGLELLDDAEDAADTKLQVSEKFAARYNAGKDRQELARARKILADEDADCSDSETEPEDEGAEMLTDQVETKIFETLNRIRRKDPSIYKDGPNIFEDNDFETTAGTSAPSKKGTTYKDFLRQTLMKDGAEAMAREEDEVDRRAEGAKFRTPNEEQRDLRSEIMKAAREAGEDEEDDDGDLFTLRDKSKEELEQEEQGFKEFTTWKDKQRTENSDEMMARYWKADEDLDGSEQFLRDFIVNEQWRENVSMQADGRGGNSDDDESELADQDDFEKEYNFRFEMDGGSQIQGHARVQETSVRERSDKRKRQRAERAERKDGEKIRRTEELKRLKNLKKQEIARRLQQLQEVTGNQELPLGNVSLDVDFDPDGHDQEMDKMLGEEYYEQEEELDPDELAKAPNEELDISKDAADALSRQKGKRKRGQPEQEEEDWGEGDEGGEGWEEEEGDGEGDWGGEEEEQEAGQELWWMCDECHKGIPGGKKRFDCVKCENYTLCQKCFRVRRHPHKFSRARVPESNMPPENWEGVEANPVEEEALDDYFQLDYEDIIGGDLPTRFKYRKVEAKDFGMSAADILNKTDQELNRLLPLKKITRTYRDAAPGETLEEDRRWKEKQGASSSSKGDSWQKGGGGSWGGGGEGKAKGNISASRMSAYNLPAPERRGGKGKSKGKDKGGGKGKGGKRDNE